jgi:hypothetical protein
VKFCSPKPQLFAGPISFHNLSNTSNH